MRNAALPRLAVNDSSPARAIWWLSIVPVLLISFGFTARLAVQSRQGFPLDFAQYYIPPRLVLNGEADDLYPQVRDAQAWINPGFYEAGIPRPAYARMERQLGLIGSSRFIQPPPTAVALLPLGMLAPKNAVFVWIMLLGISLIALAGFAAAILRAFLGNRSWWEPILIAGVLLSPRFYSAIRHANITPLAAAFGALAIWGLLRHRGAGNTAAIVGMVVGGVLKFFPGTLALVPLFVRRWWITAAVAAIALAITAITFAIVDAAPFRVYFTEIAQATARPVLHPSSHAAWQWVASSFGRHLSRESAIRIVAVAQVALAALPVILGLLTMRSPNDRERLAALATCVLSWCCLFAPVSWSHYPMFLIPSAGWVLAKCILDSRWMIPAAATLLFWLPPWYLLPVPAVSDFMVRQSPQVTFLLFYALGIAGLTAQTSHHFQVRRR